VRHPTPFYFPQVLPDDGSRTIFGRHLLVKSNKSILSHSTHPEEYHPQVESFYRCFRQDIRATPSGKVEQVDTFSFHQESVSFYQMVSARHSGDNIWQVEQVDSFCLHHPRNGRIPDSVLGTLRNVPRYTNFWYHGSGNSFSTFFPM
jgi:hypothetical protein